jgi:capsular polysaccharide export protein
MEYYKNLNLTFSPPKRLEKREFVGKQKIIEVNLPKEYIFVPFQVGYDSQIIYFSDIKDMRELFFLIKDIAEKLKINFVFKEHPSDKTNDYSDLHKIAQNSKYITFANKIDTEELIKKSSSVITINSSVGIESLIFHKKVYILGESFYRIEGITIPCNKNNLLDKLTSDIEIDFNLVDKFLAYLQNVYLVKDSWRNADKEHFKNIEKKVLECLQ